MTDIEQLIAQEFRPERFPGTLDGVQARFTARRRIRRAFAAGAVLWATAAAAVVFAVVRTPPAKPPIVATTPSAVPSPTATAISNAAFDAGCADEWVRFAAEQKLPSAMRALPPLRFDLESGRHRLRMYANDVAAMECVVDSEGKVASGGSIPVPDGTPLLRTSGRGLPMFGSMTAHGDNAADMSGYYLGRTAPGMTDVIAHIPGGPDIPAVVDGDLFLIWQPAGPLTNAVITARSQAATIIDGIVSYGRFDDNHVATADAYCRKTITELVDRHVALLSGVRGAPTVLAATAGRGDHRIWIYRRGLLLVPCHLEASAAGRIGEAILPDAADQWRVGGHVEVMTGTNAPWAHAFGAAPSGLSSLTVHLPDGRGITATVKSGAFVAQWQGKAEFQYITATVDAVRYRVAPDGTVSRA